MNLLKLVGSQANLGNLLFEEKDMKDAIRGSGTQRHLRLAKSFADMETCGMELDSAIDICFA